MPFVSYGITLPYEQLEQVELLKGASGFMYGFGNPGGTVNYITKKPTDVFTASAELGYRSSHLWSEHVDVGGRPGQHVRLPTEPDARGRQAVERGRAEPQLRIAGPGRPHHARPDLDLRRHLPGPQHLRPDAHLHHVQPCSRQPVAGRGQRPGRPVAGPDQHFYSNLQFYSTGLRYNLNADWTVSTIYSFSKQSRSRNESSLSLIDGSGNYTDLRYDGAEGHQFNQWTTMVEGRFRTGPFSHQFVGGVTWQNQINRYSSNPVSLSLDPGNLSQPYTGVLPARLRSTSTVPATSRKRRCS
jgi:iron complex outermembrane receptor protein